MEVRAKAYFIMGKLISFTFKDIKIQRLALYNLANAYKYINKIDLALETVDKYISISDDSHKYYIYAYGIKARCYEAKKDYDKAIKTYKDLILKISDNRNAFLGYAYNNLGNLHAKINSLEESLKYFDMAEKFRSVEDRKNLSHTLIEKSIVYIKQNLYEDAIKTINEGLNYAIEYTDMEYLLEGYYKLAEIYDKLNDEINLEKTYKELSGLLKIKHNKIKLKWLYGKIALMYLNQNKYDLCKEYLVLNNLI